MTGCRTNAISIARDEPPRAAADLRVVERATRAAQRRLRRVMRLRSVQPGRVGVAAVLSLSACGMAAPGASGGAPATSSRAADTPAAVPWIATAAPAVPTPTPSPLPTPTGLPMCHSRNLSARVGLAGGAALDHVTHIVFTAHAGEPCALVGFPAGVTLFDAADRVVTEYHVSLTDEGSILQSSTNGGVALFPGLVDGANGAGSVPGQAVLYLQTMDLMCGHAVVASMAIRLSDGGSFRLPINFGPDTNGDCVPQGVELSSFQPVVIMTPYVATPTDLTVTYHLPSHLQAGSVLHYSITLTNVSGHALQFSPCPGYTESLKAFGVQERHLLNCAAASGLAAGERLTFEMQLSVPRSPRFTSPDDYLTWSLDPPLQSRNDPAPGHIAVG